MAGRRPLPRSAAGAIVASLAAIVLAADQFVKHLTIQNLPLHEVVPVLGEFLQLYYVRNSGAAFSIGSSMTWIFTIALAVVSGVIIWKTLSVRSRLWAVVLGALLGGVLGNLTDRLLREPGFAVGHVVDMISMPWMMPGGTHSARSGGKVQKPSGVLTRIAPSIAYTSWPRGWLCGPVVALDIKDLAMAVMSRGTCW